MEECGCIGPLFELQEKQPLYLRSVRESSVAEIFDRAETNAVLHALRVWGPARFLSWLREAGMGDRLPTEFVSESICQACHSILSDPAVASGCAGCKGTPSSAGRSRTAGSITSRRPACSSWAVIEACYATSVSLKLAAGVSSSASSLPAPPTRPPRRSTQPRSSRTCRARWSGSATSPLPNSRRSRQRARGTRERPAAAIRALQLAFDFGRSAAPLVAPVAGAGAPASASMARAAERAAERVANAEAQLVEIDAALAKGGGSRAVLAARRNEVLAELNFAKQIRDSVQGIRSLAPGGADLLSFVDRFERSAPEVLRGAQEPPAAAASRDETGPRTESAGILALVNEAIAMSRARGEYDEVLTETETVRKSFDQLRAPLVADLTAAIRRGEAAVADSATQTPEQIDQDRRDIERMAGRFKQVSAALAPLREHGVQLDLARATLIKERETRSSATRPPDGLCCFVPAG